ncbi:MAG UNVERIFIED_CONTAM: hypothetical protein LVT10_24110 [Anaerolineae bacterium]
MNDCSWKVSLIGLSVGIVVGVNVAEDIGEGLGSIANDYFIFRRWGCGKHGGGLRGRSCWLHCLSG